MFTAQVTLTAALLVAPMVTATVSQGHLALSDTGMSVMWVSDSIPTSNTTANVQYGIHPNKLMWTTQVASSDTYKPTDLCGPPANTSTLPVPTLWSANIDFSAASSGISDNTDVYYTFGDNKERSPVHVFRRGLKETNGTTTFIAYGDMGTGDIDQNSTHEILAHIDDVDFVLHVGDISYARGDAKKWDSWFNEIEPVSTKVPYHVCLGNHEYDWPTQHYKPWDWSFGKDSGGECGIPYNKRFLMPGPPLATKGYLTGSTNIYHSRNVGTVHFVLISSEHDTSKGSEQYEWLSKDLAAVDRAKTPWVVFGQHRPYYGNTVARFLPENKQMRKVLEPLMLKYKVDLVLFGHIHQYQRTCRMVEYKCNDAGPVYNVVGTAGATHQVPFLPKPKWMKVQSDLFGISKFQAVNETHMRVRWYLDVNGTIGDEYWITRYA